MTRTSLLCFVLIGSVPFSAGASTEWATWNTAASNTSSTGSFADGRTVQLTSFFAGISGPAAAGTIYSVSPAVPGQVDGKNPSFTYSLTGSPDPSVLIGGAVTSTLDLTGFTVDADTIFGLADLKFQYRLQLLDSALTPLSLTAVQTSNYNLTYDGSGLIADLGCFLSAPTGGIFSDGAHDAGGVYVHSGLCTFSNLPTETRFIRILAGSRDGTGQETEGVQIYLGSTASAVPIPATAPLLGTAVAFVLARTLRRRASGA